MSGRRVAAPPSCIGRGRGRRSVRLLLSDLTKSKYRGGICLDIESNGFIVMQVSFTDDLEDGRAKTVIGRIKATSRWRAADGIGSEAERKAAIEALMREAAEYGADAVVDVRFELNGVKGHDIDGVALQRVTVTGLAVRFVRAA
jgi:uncharacterized protein YbjQ (UPF0145 family)